jgi:glycosyltransferase involved in cell wall biosynthesis
MNAQENMPVKPLVSVVLATKGNKTDLLEKSIKSLLLQDFKGFEIILVYSMYPEPLRQLIEKNHILAIKETGKTLGIARNLGAEKSRAEIISYIDDDAYAPTDWLANIYSVFTLNPDVACVGGPHITPPSESKDDPLRFVAGEFAQVLMGETIRTGPSAVGKIAGCNVSYRKVAFNTVGRLNKKYRSGEDWELHMRLCENGFVIRYDPQIRVWHHRQGLRHAFFNTSNMVDFFFSKLALKYARYESFFASFYLSNVLFLVLVGCLIVSPWLFVVILVLSLLGHFSLTAMRSKTLDRRLAFYPLSLLFTLARISGFYYGILKRIISKISQAFH